MAWEVLCTLPLITSLISSPLLLCFYICCSNHITVCCSSNTPGKLSTKEQPDACLLFFLPQVRIFLWSPAHLLSQIPNITFSKTSSLISAAAFLCSLFVQIRIKSPLGWVHPCKDRTWRAEEYLWRKQKVAPTQKKMQPDIGHATWQAAFALSFSPHSHLWAVPNYTTMHGALPLTSLYKQAQTLYPRS